MKHLRPSVFSVFTAGVLTLVACAPAGPSAQPTAPPAKPTTAPAQPAAAPASKTEQAGSALTPEVQKLLAAAKEKGEAELALGYAEDNFGGNEAIAEWEGLFNKMYGTSVKFRFTPGPSKDQTATQLIQEVTAGRAAFTDIGVLSATHFGGLIKADAMEAYDYSLMSPRIPKELVAPLNVGVEINTRTPGIAYNTRLIPPEKAPKSLEDTLNPEWKGKIATTPTLAQIDTIAFHPKWGPEKFKDFMRKFVPQVGGLIRGGETPRIASGEFLMLVVVSGEHDVAPLKKEGAPIELVVPSDSATFVAEFVAIPRTAAHPNLAKLYTNMLLSEEGQKVMYKYINLDHASLPGSQSAARVQQLRAQGVEFFNAGIQFEIDHPEKRVLKDELVGMLRVS